MIVKETTILASSLPGAATKTKENCSIVFVSKDNKSFAINLLSSTSADPDVLPGSVSATATVPEGSKVLARIVSDQNMSNSTFNRLSRCKVIANSVDDRLKAYKILRELESVL